MIKAVLFDIDGVLLDSRAANHKFEEDIVVKAGYKKPTEQELSKVYHLTLYETIKYLTKEESDEKVKMIWQSAIDDYEIKYPRELLKLPSGMIKTIEQLNKQYKLAIVTGRLKRGVETFYQVSGLEKYFKAVSSSDDYLKPKPDPEPLLVALSKLKMEPQEAVYVGDSKSDLIPSKALGMKFICFYAVSKKKFAEADANINSFKDLPGIIAKIEKKL